MKAYYNENDRYAADWLENLIAAGHIPEGDVDRRSIRDVRPGDLRGYSQCHFFAGIGGWPLALRLAGWPDSRPVWTGSCPCQPFSNAGKRKGVNDDRHLWPVFAKLIGECGPSTVFGEQVASRDGRDWLSDVRLDLESMGYAVGAADLCAASVGAPHARQRLYWLAHADSWERDGEPIGQRGNGPDQRAIGAASLVGGLEHAPCYGREQRRAEPSRRGASSGRGEMRGFWTECDWLPCSDGKHRPVEPGAFPLAHGVSGRVGRLRAYGNAIVPQVAVAFIRASTEALRTKRAS